MPGSIIVHHSCMLHCPNTQKCTKNCRGPALVLFRRCRQEVEDAACLSTGVHLEAFPVEEHEGG